MIQKRAYVRFGPIQPAIAEHCGLWRTHLSESTNSPCLRTGTVCCGFILIRDSVQYIYSFWSGSVYSTYIHSDPGQCTVHIFILIRDSVQYIDSLWSGTVYSKYIYSFWSGTVYSTYIHSDWQLFFNSDLYNFIEYVHWHGIYIYIHYLIAMQGFVTRSLQYCQIPLCVRKTDLRIKAIPKIY